MNRFSASDVAMTGFGVVARRPTVLVWWILLHLLFIGASTEAFVTFAGPALTEWMALRSQHTPMDTATQAQSFTLFWQILPLYTIMLPVMLVFYAVLFAAMNRAVLRPAKSAFGYLRLGADEWRQFLLVLWAMVLGVALEIALVVVGVILAILAALIFAAINKGAAASATGAGLTVLAPLALALLFIAAYTYVLVRFSLASAMTFDTGKVSLLKSWRLTRGRFWPMFGAYALAAILSIVVSLLGLVVMIVCAMLISGGGIGTIFRPDMSSSAAYFTPARLVYFALSGVLYALVWPILLTPSAAIYKALTAPKPTPASWPSPPPPPVSPPSMPVDPSPFEPTSESPSEPAPFCALPDDPERP